MVQRTIERDLAAIKTKGLSFVRLTSNQDVGLLSKDKNRQILRKVMKGNLKNRQIWLFLIPKMIPKWHSRWLPRWHPNVTQSVTQSVTEGSSQT